MTCMRARWEDVFGVGPVVIDGGLYTQLAHAGHYLYGQI